MKKSAEEIFWEKVNKSGPIPAHVPHLGECWEWTGKLNRKGYGEVSIERQGKRANRSNRVAWLLSRGEFPKLWVLHKCDNRKCVRPDHLFLGTAEDNRLDTVRKGRARVPSGFPRTSERRRGHRLTETEAAKVLELKRSGVQNTKIATMFCVHFNTVSSVGRKTWTRLLGDSGKASD